MKMKDNIEKCVVCGGSLVPIVYAWDVTVQDEVSLKSNLKQIYKLYRCSECGIVYTK